jgi:transposase
MARFTKAKNHLTVDEIDKKIRAVTGFWLIRRWMIIRQAVVEQTTAEQIAARCGVKKQTVANLISTYNKYGEAAVETIGRGQRQKAYLSVEEEKEFLCRFDSEAEKGRVATIKTIHDELEKYLGHKVHETTVYRMLKRHGWRKIMPRSTHPKSSKEKRETFKKTSPIKLRRS